MSIESVMPSNHLILCLPLLLLPSIFPSIRFFSNELSHSSQIILAYVQITGASASVLPVNTQGWFPLLLTDLISLQSKGHFQESSPAPQFKNINSSVLSLLYGPVLTLWLPHEYHCYPNTGICYGSWIFMSVQLPNIQEVLGRCRDWFLLIIWQWNRNSTLIPEAVFLLVYLVSFCSYGESCSRIKKS